ncbi:MAG: hypothetical protein ACJA08_001245 [Cyclobacteriaceae bacterium]|jgi:hypothetical protein
MKKNILILMVSLAFIVIACETEEIDPGAAANNQLSGEWFVHYDHSVFGADPFGVGYTRILTATTASESATDFIVTDEANFWDYRVKAKMDLSSKKFGSSDTLVSFVDDYDIKVLIRNGAIYEDAVTTVAGVLTDSIYFEIWFEDLDGATGIVSDTLVVSGYRRTGFTEDEH